MGKITTNKIIPVSRLRVGQRFTWIPREWYGDCKLLSKFKREEYDWNNKQRITKYDLKFDAAVVNPPGVIYGVLSDTKVRLLK